MKSNTLRQLSLFLAWLIAISATLITLYLSEIKQLPVCNLCWYQRICLYPLSIILGIATYQSDYKVGRYAIPLALIGIVFATYQYLEQMIPGFAPLGMCTQAVPCNVTHFILLGFITLPLLSAMAGLLILALLLIAWFKK